MTADAGNADAAPLQKAATVAGRCAGAIQVPIHLARLYIYPNINYLFMLQLGPNKERD